MDFFARHEICSKNCRNDFYALQIVVNNILQFSLLAIQEFNSNVQCFDAYQFITFTTCAEFCNDIKITQYQVYGIKILITITENVPINCH